MYLKLRQWLHTGKKCCLQTGWSPEDFRQGNILHICLSRSTRLADSTVAPIWFPLNNKQLADFSHVVSMQYKLVIKFLTLKRIVVSFITPQGWLRISQCTMVCAEELGLSFMGCCEPSGIKPCTLPYQPAASAHWTQTWTQKCSSCRAVLSVICKACLWPPWMHPLAWSPAQTPGQGPADWLLVPAPQASCAGCCVPTCRWTQCSAAVCNNSDNQRQDSGWWLKCDTWATWKHNTW